mmetsp:Transcript_7595/g.13276  ORF Transcript_7595/g.13276 Transcript_7595/m.13276 type:complete len:108 (-) Transcript_7595:55-378(-)
MLDLTAKGQPQHEIESQEEDPALWSPAFQNNNMFQLISDMLEARVNCRRKLRAQASAMTSAPSPKLTPKQTPKQTLKQTPKQVPKQVPKPKRSRKHSSLSIRRRILL